MISVKLKKLDNKNNLSNYEYNYIIIQIKLIIEM